MLIRRSRLVHNEVVTGGSIFSDMWTHELRCGRVVAISMSDAPGTCSAKVVEVVFVTGLYRSKL